MQVKSARDQEDSNKELFSIATVIGALLYAPPYRSISMNPALGDSYKLINPDYAPYCSISDPSSSSCSSDGSQESYSSIEEHSDTPCQHDSSQLRDSLHNQHSSNALQDLHVPELTAVNRCQVRTEASDSASAGQPQLTAQSGAFSSRCGETTPQFVWDHVACMELTDTHMQRLTPPIWADIETVALRALVTLDWVTEHAGRADLMQLLITIVHCLLVAHATDPQHDMTRVLKFGLVPVLNALSHSQSLDVVTMTFLRHLACMLLRRVLTDRVAFQTLYGDGSRGEGHPALEQPGLRQLSGLIRKISSSAASNHCACDRMKLDCSLQRYFVAIFANVCMASTHTPRLARCC